MCQLCAKGLPGVGEIFLPVFLIAISMGAIHIEHKIRSFASSKMKDYKKQDH